ncbi:MAG: bifunctional UDP-N-acetylglucosamine diphosphorylase/glucosamine-1-phosphate N-acetyltransferase GlmU [Pseudomonadota bacterium]
MSTALIVLAAGQGTRMNSELPKVLHQIAGAPMVLHALRSGSGLDPEHTVVVTGHGADKVEEAVRSYRPDAIFAHQAEQKGTGHAVLQAMSALEGFTGDTAVLFGDTPFVSAETLRRMSEARKAHDVVCLGFEARDPGRYGRLVMSGETLERIVEFKDADAATRNISFCNSGLLTAPTPLLLTLLNKIKDDNAAGEYYLTDVIALARAGGHSCTAISCDEAETLGINTRADLATAEATFQTNARAEAMENGVTLSAPESVHFGFDTVIGRDTVVEQNVVFGPGVSVESGARIRAFSHLEGCHVAQGAIVGPYARLRPGTELSEDTRIGNFVEVKNSQIGHGAKVNHLSYIGDASLGEATNIGAGTITCNYDGVMKHRTEIGERVFIGSNTMLVAPVQVGDDAMTASGSVITKDVPEAALAVARGRQENKPGLALKLFEALKIKKARKDKEGK